jgi:hypothetical protein
VNARAKGLFRATGKNAKPIMVDILDGEAVYVESLEREKDDFYPTPPEPTRAILHAERGRLETFPLIWEAAAGDGAMVREMQTVGLKTVASDMVDRGCGAQIRSFYDFKEPLAPAIVTNPPFAECNTGAWITHALDRLSVEYMALLLPVNWMGAIGRAALWEAHAPARVYLMRWRIDFTGRGSPPMLNAWYVWDGYTHPNDTRLMMLDRKDVRQTELSI